MYRTSKEGMRKIRRDLLRQTPLSELEAMARNNPHDTLLYEVLRESIKKIHEIYRTDNFCGD